MTRKSLITKLANVCAVTLITLAINQTAVGADQYVLDNDHTAIIFGIKHLNMSYTYGRFNDVEGQFMLDADTPSNSSFKITVKTRSIDTGLKKRDDHLRSPDFFNANQFPVITFETTGVKAASNGYRVSGKLSLHGVTKPITLYAQKLGEGDDPWGNYRAGFATELTLKRSDYGMTNMPEAVGDEVKLMISFEGLRQ